MDVREIKLEVLDRQGVIRQQCCAIAAEVGDGTAVNALSGGVDSSVVTMLAHRALGPRLKTFFIDNGLMRHGKRDYGPQIEVRCWDTQNAVTARPTTFHSICWSDWPGA